jgi:hypothetical protein
MPDTSSEADQPPEPPLAESDPSPAPEPTWPDVSEIVTRGDDPDDYGFKTRGH